MEKKLYAYGMPFRPRQPAAQPNDYIDWEDYFEDRHKLSSGEEVWSILWYARELRDDEINNYELIRLEGRDKMVKTKPIKRMDAETARESIIAILGEEDGKRVLANFWEMLSVKTIRTRYTDGSVRLEYYDPKTEKTKILNVNADKTWDILETDGNQETREEYYPDHTAHVRVFLDRKLVKAEWKVWKDGKVENTEWNVITPEAACEMLSGIGVEAKPERIWVCECSPDHVLHFECLIVGYAYQVDLINRRYRRRDMDSPCAWTEWADVKSPVQLLM